jgi:hypothetical protein
MKTRPEDILLALDSLQELFQEYGEAVTPALLLKRMERKAHRRMPMQLVAYLYWSLGFVTRAGPGNSYCIIPNPSLLAEKRSQFCKDSANSNNRPLKH